MNSSGKSQQILEYVHLSEPVHEDGRKLIALWQERQSEGGFVMGRDIPSRSTASLLDRIMILEPLSDRSDYYIRLSGSSLRRRWGGESTGLKLSDIFGAEWFETQLNFTNQVHDTGQPLILDATQYDEGVLHRVPVRREIILLRILSPDMKTHWILVGVFYKD